MKRKLGIFLVALCAMFGVLFNYGYKASASNYVDDVSNYPKARGLGSNPNYTFNIIKGYSTVDGLLNSQFYRDLYEGMIGMMYNGTFEYEGMFNGDYDYQAHCDIEFTSGDVEWIKVYVFNTLIYEVYNEGGNYRIDTCTEVLMSDYVTGVNTFTFEVTNFSFPNDYNDDFDWSYIDLVGFNCIRCMTYSYNETYKGDEVHFYTDIRQPLSDTDILNSVSSYDFTDGNATLSIINSNIDRTNYGTYTLDIKAVDTSGNVTIQKCYYTVTLIQKPSISAGDLNASYSKYTDPNSFFVYDSSMNSEITEDNYTSNWNSPGSYTVTMHITDEFGNYNDLTVTVVVKDDVPPIITYQNKMVTTINPYTEDDLRVIASAYDTVKGSIPITFVDIDGYLSNTKKVGTYRIGVSASDDYSTASAEVKIEVVDADCPTITVGMYTIVVPEGTPISRDEIVACVKQTGVSELSDVISDYFDVDGANGTYDATLITDGASSATIEAGYSDSISYNPYLPTTNNNNKINSNYFIFGGIACGLLAVILVMGRIVRKKKH